MLTQNESEPPLLHKLLQEREKVSEEGLYQTWLFVEKLFGGLMVFHKVRKHKLLSVLF